MRTTWNWLSSFIDLDGLTPQQVADGLTQAGVEVEGIEELGRELDGVVVGRIIKRESHPDADKLSVCEVDIGTGEPLQIVCGAPNARDGLVSAVATVGATLPGDFKIKKSKIRGVKSFGMLCSGDELGTGGDHSGILELDPELAIGTPIADAMGVRDFVFELSLTPNRADCLSTYGLAREIATLFNLPLKRHIAPTEDLLAGLGGSNVAVTIDDAEGCSTYACAVIKGVKVAPSPEWLQRALLSIGLRPVNNIVDVTNYAMYENGQPLHAFDLNILKDSQIVVRRARPEETIESIDHVERALDPTDLLICDAASPVAIAGVMGGAGSEISDDTTDILIECAHFDPTTVRKTARRQGMHTDSSHRFERGVDPNGIDACLARAVELVAETQKAINQPFNVVGSDKVVARTIAPLVITMAKSMPGRILGIPVSDAQIHETLTGLGLTVADAGDDVRVTVPTFRPDLERPIDLVEEVGRVIGFDNLADVLPSGEPGRRHQRRDDAPVAQHAQPVQDDERLADLRRAREAAADHGFAEAVNWALADPAKLDALRGAEDRIRLQNPLSEDRSVMRTTLLTGLLDNVAHNIAHGAERIALFEVGTRFPGTRSVHGERDEPVTFAAVLSGVAERGWYAAGREATGQDLVGLIDALGEVLRRPLRVVTGEVPRWAHPGITARVTLEGADVGWVGAVHPSALDLWGIGQTVYAAELDLESILAREATPLKYTEIPRTPASTRDVALLVARELPYQSVESALERINNKLLESVELFDVYVGSKVDADKKSLALRMTYRREGASLKDAQVEAAHTRIVDHLEKTLGATKR